MPEHELQGLPEEVGVESEDDATQPSAEQIRQAFVTGSDWTTETIVSQLRKGNINLNPSFQRREVWTRSRKSTLIESIVLNLPIPQIVLAERKDQANTYIVLDGKQRLLTIRQFCVDPAVPSDQEFETLFLESLSIRPDLNGECYQTLSANPSFTDVVNAFDNHTIRTVVIRNWPNSDYLHRVFLRLNTGSVPLSPQELRQALNPGPFTEFLDQFASQSKQLHRALGIDGPDFRMRDNEVLLRYLAYAKRADEYAGNLKKFLDDTAARLNDRWLADEQSIRQEAARCETAIDTTESVFGPSDSFTTYNGHAFERRFNRAVFDIMTYYFREPAIAAAAVAKKDEVKKAYIDLTNVDTEFAQSLTTTTKSKRATAKRFVAWADELKSTLGIAVLPPAGFRQILD